MRNGSAVTPPLPRCPFCRRTFHPSPYRRDQRVCSEPACQQKRRAEYHRLHRSQDAVYGDTCRNSQKNWREANPGYQRQYRQQHPQSQQQNRERQHSRDAKRRLRRNVLEKNTLAFDLKPAVSAVWLVGPAAAHLEKNTLASTQVLLLQELPAAHQASLPLEKNTHLDPSRALPYN